MEYCKRCKRETEHKRLNKGENYDSECVICGTKIFHIQGFNADLM